MSGPFASSPAYPAHVRQSRERERESEARQRAYDLIVSGHRTARPRDVSKPLNHARRPASAPERVTQAEFEDLHDRLAESKAEVRTLRRAGPMRDKATDVLPSARRWSSRWSRPRPRRTRRIARPSPRACSGTPPT